MQIVRERILQYLQDNPTGIDDDVLAQVFELSHRLVEAVRTAYTKLPDTDPRGSGTSVALCPKGINSSAKGNALECVSQNNISLVQSCQFSRVPTNTLLIALKAIKRVFVGTRENWQD